MNSKISDVEAEVEKLLAQHQQQTQHYAEK